MRSLILIISIMIFFYSELISQRNIFNYVVSERISTNYNGSAYNGSAIIVYGEAGIITRTSDGGREWGRIELANNYNILSMTTIGSTFYGITNIGYIIMSTDDGSIWKSIPVESSALFKVLSYDDKVYCLSADEILVYDSNLNYIEKLNANSDENYFDFTIADNSIFYSAGLGKIGKIDLNTKISSTIDLSFLGICSDCPLVKNLFSENGIVYFSLSNKLYEFAGSKVKLTFNATSLGLYTSFGGEIYQFFNRTYPLPLPIDSLYFLKIDKTSGQSTQVNNPGNDRYIKDLKFKKVDFISNDTVLAVGKDNLIYMSVNKGIDWNLQSYFNGAYSTERFDELNSASVLPNVQFLHSSNHGITWLPQKNADKLFGNFEFEDPWNCGYIDLIDPKQAYIYIYEKASNDTNFAYTIDGYENVILKNVEEVKGYRPDKKFLSCQFDTGSIFVFPGTFGSNWNFTVLYELDKNINVTSRILLDSMHVIFIDKYKGELVAIAMNYRYPQKGDDGKWSYLINNFSLLRSIDGKEWKNIMDFNLPKCIGWLTSPTLIKDNIFLNYSYTSDSPDAKSWADIYKLDLRSGEVSRILHKKEFSFILNSLSYIGSKLILNGCYFTDNGIKTEILMNPDNLFGIDKWINLTPSQRYGECFLTGRNDSLLIITAYDSLYKSKVLWFAKSNEIVSVSDNIEKVESLFLSDPEPNPSTEIARIKVWWDISNNFGHSDIQIYDLLGSNISQNCSISLTKYNDHSGEIVLGLKDLNSGIYFVYVKSGNSKRTMALIVSK